MIVALLLFPACVQIQLSRIGYTCADAERTTGEEPGAADTQGESTPVSGSVLESKIRSALEASIVQAGEMFVHLRDEAWRCRYGAAIARDT